jgi:DNA-binding XRE family transcriptional regulator
MDLLEYRKQRGVSLASLARTVGANPHSLSQIAHGRRRPSWRLAGLIETATDGAVERDQWFPVSLPAALAATPGALYAGPGLSGEAEPSADVSSGLDVASTRQVSTNSSQSDVPSDGLDRAGEQTIATNVAVEECDAEQHSLNAECEP